jgi:hypothetical protein
MQVDVSVQYIERRSAVQGCEGNENEEAGKRRSISNTLARLSLNSHSGNWLVCPIEEYKKLLTPNF